MFVFFYEKCVPRWFYYFLFFVLQILFVFFHHACFLSFRCVSTLARVFTKIHTKNYCSTVCVCCVASVLVCLIFFLFGCVQLCLLSCVLLQYQIATMVQILQINLICFFFLLKYVMIFSSSFVCVAALYNLAYQVLYQFSVSFLLRCYTCSRLHCFYHFTFSFMTVYKNIYFVSSFHYIPQFSWYMRLCVCFFYVCV